MTDHAVSVVIHGSRNRVEPITRSDGQAVVQSASPVLTRERNLSRGPLYVWLVGFATIVAAIVAVLGLAPVSR